MNVITGLDQLRNFRKVLKKVREKLLMKIKNLLFYRIRKTLTQLTLSK